MEQEKDRGITITQVKKCDLGCVVKSFIKRIAHISIISLYIDPNINQYVFDLLNIVLYNKSSTGRSMFMVMLAPSFIELHLFWFIIIRKFY